MSKRVLVVGRDTVANSVLERLLTSENYVVAIEATGRDALARCSLPKIPALIICDENIGDMSGTELCRQIRQSSSFGSMPFVLLTEHDAEIDIVVALQLGADDCIPKPYHPREFLLRIEAILRRSYDSAQENIRWLVGDLHVDCGKHLVLLRGQPLPLTQTEFRLLEILMLRYGRPQSRETLLADIWGHGTHAGPRTVDTHVRRLRQKLGSSRSLIRTVRGLGYCFGH